LAAPVFVAALAFFGAVFFAELVFFNAVVFFAELVFLVPGVFFDAVVFLAVLGFFVVRRGSSTPNCLRSSTLACSSFFLRLAESPLPARLMKNVSIDIAEWYGEDLRRCDCSASRLSARAISAGSFRAKVPPSMSSASLV
jgi:hypothetical protein